MPTPTDIVADLWDGVGGHPGVVERLVVSGPEQVLPSTFAVTAAATAAIGAATLAVADVAGGTGAAGIDTRHAAAAVRSERHAGVVGAERRPLWDPVAGDYAAADGWIRLHTNYTHHRRAALAVLDAAAERDAVAAAVRTWPADGLESAVVAAGGCAAALRPMEAWRRHEHGARVDERPVIAVDRHGDAPVERHEIADRHHPLAGLRVLDLTKVIAGPVASRFLASWGAEVLRVEAPGVDDLEDLAIDVGFGKRSCRLDLSEPGDRAAFEALVTRADVVVHGYRPGALAGLGYDPDAVASLRPGVVVAGLSAYGPVGPWRDRRGFDSLVQMSTGIAAEGATGP